ncbi:hypothetical protein ACYZT7_07385 [Pseudomonas sp. RT4P38]
MTQLAKEFWLPFVIAVAWTMLALWDEVVDTKSVVGNFGSAFFFASWMTGQIFRVRKQAGVESSLLAVEGRIQAVTERLETQTKELVGHVTGGTSYCYVQVGHPNLQGGNLTRWILKHRGDTPFTMYAVSVSIVDLDSFHKNLMLGRKIEQNFNIGEFSLGTTEILFDRFDLGTGDARSFNVFLYARNGNLTQQVRFRRVNDEWRLATRVIHPQGEIIHTDVEEDFPRDATGDVDWNENTLSGGAVLNGAL